MTAIDTTPASPSVGWIGLGAMGTAMAARLAARGRDVLAWNRDPARAAEAGAHGIAVTSDLAEAASRQVVFSMLSDDAAVREVLAGTAVLPAVSPGSVHVNCATVSPGLADELDGLYRSRNARYVAAPVFGRPAAARAGELTVIAGGDADSLSLIRPLLSDLAVSVHIFSRPGQANLVKALGNYLIAVTASSLGEVAGIAENGGIAAADLLGVLTERLFSGAIHRAYGGMIAERRYEPVAFPMRLGKKDVDLVRAEAARHGGRLPLGDVIAGAFDEELGGAAAGRDWASVAEWFRSHAGGTR